MWFFVWWRYFETDRMWRTEWWCGPARIRLHLVLNGWSSTTVVIGTSTMTVTIPVRNTKSPVKPGSQMWSAVFLEVSYNLLPILSCHIFFILWGSIYWVYLSKYAWKIYASHFCFSMATQCFVSQQPTESTLMDYVAGHVFSKDWSTTKPREA